jgi:type III secretion protein J
MNHAAKAPSVSWARVPWWLALTALLATLMSLAGCKDTLFGKLSESQANEVLAALSEAHIEAAKTRIDETAWQIEVEAAQAGAALVYLRDRGLPTQRTASMGEVFKKEGLISSPVEERARLAFALQEDLATTLRRIDGVVEARVHVAIPKNDPLSDKQIPASAAVFLKYRSQVDIEMLSPEIKKMVMTSIEGLDFRNISLFALPTDGAAAAATPARGGVQQVSVKRQAPVAASMLPSDLGSGFGWASVALGCISLIGFVLPWRRGRAERVSNDEPASAAVPATSLNTVTRAAKQVSDKMNLSGLAPLAAQAGTALKNGTQQAARGVGALFTTRSDDRKP